MGFLIFPTFDQTVKYNAAGQRERPALPKGVILAAINIFLQVTHNCSVAPTPLANNPATFLRELKLLDKIGEALRLTGSQLYRILRHNGHQMKVTPYVSGTGATILFLHLRIEFGAPLNEFPHLSYFVTDPEKAPVLEVVMGDTNDIASGGTQTAVSAVQLDIVPEFVQSDKAFKQQYRRVLQAETHTPAAAASQGSFPITTAGLGKHFIRGFYVFADISSGTPSDAFINEIKSINIGAGVKHYNLTWAQAQADMQRRTGRAPDTGMIYLPYDRTGRWEGMLEIDGGDLSMTIDHDAPTGVSNVIIVPDRYQPL